MKWIYDLSHPQLKAALSRGSFKTYNADQIFSWLYRKLQPDISQWTDISGDNREILKQEFNTSLLEIRLTEGDGAGTRRFLLALHDGHEVEAVRITEKDHYTFCISSQAGCPLGCTFCDTARLGLIRDLTAGEILNQVLILKETISPYSGKLNIVFMGMGDPLLNLTAVIPALEVITSPEALGISPRSITISTVGMVAEMKELLDFCPNLKLSISLNAPTEELRNRLMPSRRKSPLPDIIDFLRNHRPRYRVTLIYVLLRDINDSPRQAGQLADLLRGIPCKVNLVPFNPNSRPFTPPEESRIDDFARRLRDRHLTVTVRWSKGETIHAACGQLALTHRTA